MPIEDKKLLYLSQARDQIGCRKLENAAHHFLMR